MISCQQNFDQFLGAHKNIFINISLISLFFPKNKHHIVITTCVEVVLFTGQFGNGNFVLKKGIVDIIKVIDELLSTII